MVNNLYDWVNVIVQFSEYRCPPHIHQELIGNFYSWCPVNNMLIALTSDCQFLTYTQNIKKIYIFCNHHFLRETWSEFMIFSQSIGIHSKRRKLMNARAKKNHSIDGEWKISGHYLTMFMCLTTKLLFSHHSLLLISYPR